MSVSGTYPERCILIGYIVKSHAWKVPVLGFMLAGALFVTAGSAQAAAPPASVPVRTHAYTYTSGSTVVLQEPVGATAAAKPFAAMAPSVDVHGCGFLTLCLDLNKTDQEALTNGSSAALGVAICALPAVGQVACGFVIAALAIAATYVSNNGVCANKLQLTLGPVPGKGGLARCV